MLCPMKLPERNRPPQISEPGAWLLINRQDRGDYLMHQQR
jgi:hypothetical protein